VAAVSGRTVCGVGVGGILDPGCVLFGSVVWVMRTISVQPLCLALRGIGWEGWLPGP
jgi:hypothetical protein